MSLHYSDIIYYKNHCNFQCAKYSFHENKGMFVMRVTNAKLQSFAHFVSNLWCLSKSMIFRFVKLVLSPNFLCNFVSLYTYIHLYKLECI